jgi:hypothetical protein
MMRIESGLRSGTPPESDSSVLAPRHHPARKPAVPPVDSDLTR